MRLSKVFIIAITLLSAISCGNRSKKVIDIGDSLYKPAYSIGFEIYATEGHSSIVKFNSLYDKKKKTSEYIFISRNNEQLPDSVKWQTIKAPLRRVVCMSSSYVAFIDALGEVKTIKGVSGKEYISNEVLHSGISSGSVKDIGYDANINYEIIAQLSPDAVFIYGIGGENTAIKGKLRELGIDVITISDHLEGDPLGKAEWIVMFGELFDKREEGKLIFNNIAQKYESLRKEASMLTPRPKVMLNAPYRDVWFVPGDNNYIVRLINDAGGEHACAGVSYSGSRPISGEAAYIAANDSDIWINPNQYTTIKELTLDNPKFSNVKPILNKQVYNCTKRRTQGGGSDLWESGALRADVALEDLIMCLHPDWKGGKDKVPYYFIKLE